MYEDNFMDIRLGIIDFLDVSSHSHCYIAIVSRFEMILILSNGKKSKTKHLFNKITLSLIKYHKADWTGTVLETNQLYDPTVLFSYSAKNLTLRSFEMML